MPAADGGVARAWAAGVGKPPREETAGKGDKGGSSRAMGIWVPRMLRVIEYETIRGVDRRGCGF
jgi:hypothetical protein